MTVAKARCVRLRVNALGGERAMLMALEKAGDLVFSERCPEWDEEDLPSIQDYGASEEIDAGGYDILVIRRGYAQREDGGEYDADYAIAACSNGNQPFDNPDVSDPSEEYAAAVAAGLLDRSTIDGLRRAQARRI